MVWKKHVLHLLICLCYSKFWIQDLFLQHAFLFKSVFTFHVYNYKEKILQSRLASLDEKTSNTVDMHYLTKTFSFLINIFYFKD